MWLKLRTGGSGLFNDQTSAIADQFKATGNGGGAGPLAFYLPMILGGHRLCIPSVDECYSVHMLSLELCIPFNCCECIVF